MTSKLTIMITPLLVLSVAIISGILVWALISGMLVAGYYDLKYFFIPISEWDGGIRIMLYFYVVFSVGLTSVVAYSIPQQLRNLDSEKYVNLKSKEILKNMSYFKPICDQP